MLVFIYPWVLLILLSTLSVVLYVIAWVFACFGFVFASVFVSVLKCPLFQSKGSLDRFNARLVLPVYIAERLKGHRHKDALVVVAWVRHD